MGDSADAPLEPSCPLGCGPLLSDATILRDNRFGLPHAVRVGWCRSCGLGVTLDPPTRDELSELYRETYADEGTAGQVPRTGAAARIWHMVNGSLALTDRDLRPPVLDVGANTGETLLALRARGIDAVGLEPNPKAVAIARAAGLNVIEASIEAAGLPHGYFNTILLSQVLVRSALHREGVVYIVVPNARSVWRRIFGPDWVHWHVPFHLYHHTERSLARLCTQHGLRVQRVSNITPGEWLLMSLEARRNARAGRDRLEPFSNRYGRRALIAPLGRLFDVMHRGDAIVAEAVHAA